MNSFIKIVVAIIIFPILMATTYAVVIFSYLLTPLIIAVFILAFIFVSIGGLDKMD